MLKKIREKCFSYKWISTFAIVFLLCIFISQPTSALEKSWQDEVAESFNSTGIMGTGNVEAPVFTK